MEAGVCRSFVGRSRDRDAISVRRGAIDFVGAENSSHGRDAPGACWSVRAGNARLIDWYARACGVGPSLSVLTKRAKDVAKLLVPLRADDIVASLAKWVSESPEAGIAQMHVYPLGGIEPAASWIASTTGESG